MIQTNQEELQAFYAAVLPGFLEYLRTHGIDVGDIEIASSLDGLTSLPAHYSSGGVEKTVLAPLDLLTADAEAEAEAARQAAADANEAAATANTAAGKVTTAITDISAEKKAAIDAAASANKAADIANNAATSATTAATKAATATTAANSATETLTTVKTECANAQAAASSAAQTAEEKITEMEALMKSFSAEGTSAPVRMEVTAPETISSRCKVARRIVVALYPSYILQNVLFQRAEGDSLRADPSGVLTLKDEGETTFYIIPTQNTPLWQEVTVKVRPPRMRLTSTGKIRRNGSRIRIV